jgi:hypothetical protein
MKKCGLLILVACFYAINCIAQDSTEVLLHIPGKGKTIRDFIPKGYHQVFAAKGDFNKDGREDKVVVIEEGRQRRRRYSGFDRILLILFMTKNGWTLAGRSDHVMLPADWNNDPMIKMNAKSNSLEIHQLSFSHGTLSNCTNTFKYQDNNFFLVRRVIDSSTIQVKCEQLNEYRSKKHEDINFVTGVRVQKKISYYCELLIDKTDTIAIQPLLKLSEVTTE